ncbi:MAG TPA: YCF48-related protein [Candidatus Saccharimonadales bacterium]|nr:YCF48-related protein [Candidatus Saccharimonadales bacterium]
MPSDDREQKFENALAGHVRANSSAGVSRNPCADAEMLAAYHQGALPPEQIASLKTHVTDCSRCQEILALLDATDELAGAPVEAPRAAAAPTAPAVRVLPARKPTLWRWVAPAGALAAVLLVWISVRENNSLRIPPQAPTVNVKSETAKELSSSPKPLALPQSSSAAQAVPAAPTDTVNALTAAPESKMDATRRERTQALLKQKELSSEQKKSRVDDLAQFLEKSPDNDTSLALDSNARSAAQAKAAKDQRDALDLPSSSALSGGAVAGAIAPAPPQAPAPEPGRRSQANAALSPVGAPVLQRQQIEVSAEAKPQTEIRLANAISEVTISAPGDRVSWRIGQAGLIAFSSDAGKTWTTQPSGVITDLLAGSSPSEKVCWIVGRAGTILRTTDGGAHWQKVRSPTQDDIRSVAAQDARQATISLTNAVYQTTDAGAAWNKLAPE